MTSKPHIAIVGAGMGGLTAAAALLRFGFQVQVFEQADGFSRIGAGIQISPNAMNVLRGLGLDKQIRATAFQTQTWGNRVWDTGAMKFELSLGPTAEAQFGAPICKCIAVIYMPPSYPPCRSQLLN
jgi:6-hydroxynicotinate 3-monooxygenase